MSFEFIENLAKTHGEIIWRLCGFISASYNGLIIEELEELLEKTDVSVISLLKEFAKLPGIPHR